MTTCLSPPTSLNTLLSRQRPNFGWHFRGRLAISLILTLGWASHAMADSCYDPMLMSCDDVPTMVFDQASCEIVGGTFYSGTDDCGGGGGGNTPPSLGGAPADVVVTVNVATAIDLSAYDIADPDELTAVTIALIVSRGTIASADGNGDFITDSVAIATSGTEAMTLTGTPAFLNAYLDDTSHIIYTSANNDTSSATLSVTTHDGTEPGETDSIGITVISAGNTPPTAASFTVSAGPYDNRVYTFTTGDFGYTDADGDALNHLLIEAVPTAGTLYVDADNSDSLTGTEALSNGATVSRADLDAGHLQYIQAGTANETFQFEVNDGTADSSGNYTVTLNVLPLVSLAVDTATIAEDASDPVTLTVSLSNTDESDTLVTLAFSGQAQLNQDFTSSMAADNQLTVNAGTSSASATLFMSRDADTEGDETVVVDISNVVGGLEDGTQKIEFVITDVANGKPTFTLIETRIRTVPGGVEKLVLTATDPEDDALVFSIGSGPDWVSVEEGLIPDVSVFAGSGSPGFTDGDAATAAFKTPTDLAVGSDGKIYVADSENHRIRVIDTDGTVSTLAGTGVQGGADGLVDEAQFHRPERIALDGDDNVYVLDGSSRNRLRKIAGGQVTTLTLPDEIHFRDHPDPVQLAGRIGFDIAVSSTGIIYIVHSWSDQRSVGGYLIYSYDQVTPPDTAITLYGQFFWRNLDLDESETKLLVREGFTYAGKVGEIDIASGTYTEFFNMARRGYANGPVAGVAALPGWSHIGMDDQGKVYILESNGSADGLQYDGNRIRVVEKGATSYQDGSVSTFAGTSKAGFSNASPGQFRTPGAIAVVNDASVPGGVVVYVAEEGKHRIRRVTQKEGAYLLAEPPLTLTQEALENVKVVVKVTDSVLNEGTVEVNFGDDTVSSSLSWFVALLSLLMAGVYFRYAMPRPEYRPKS
jgi:hypothetical protein